jgi:hypothetical protein
VALGFATLYVGVAWRIGFHGSRGARRCVVIVVGFAPPMWRWEIAGIGRRSTSYRTTTMEQPLLSLARPQRLPDLPVCGRPATLLSFIRPSPTSWASRHLCPLCSRFDERRFHVLVASRAPRLLALTGGRTVRFTFLIASVFIETEHLWVTAFLLVLYAVAAYRISDQVRRTTRKLLRTHQVTDQLRHASDRARAGDAARGGIGCALRRADGYRAPADLHGQGRPRDPHPCPDHHGGCRVPGAPTGRQPGAAH